VERASVTWQWGRRRVARRWQQRQFRGWAVRVVGGDDESSHRRSWGRGVSPRSQMVNGAGGTDNTGGGGGEAGPYSFVLLYAYCLNRLLA
jgi:hypothetical protein